MTEIEQHRDRAQTTHDAADAQGVGNGLAQTILLGDLKIDHRARLVATDLEHGDHIVGPIHRFAPIGRRLDGRVGIQGFVDLVGHNRRSAQPLGVDVEEAEGAILQFGIAEDITHQILGKDGTTGTDKGNFR